MKKIAVLLTILVVSTTFAQGQNAAVPISTKKIFGGYQYYQGESMLNINQLVNAMEPNQEAYRQIRSARASHTMTMILSYAGGFMVGWPIGTAIGGGEPNWAMAGIGAGLIGVSIPLNYRFNKKARKAVELYNMGLPTSSLEHHSELKLSLTGNGLGVRLSF